MSTTMIICLIILGICTLAIITTSLYSFIVQVKADKALKKLYDEVIKNNEEGK